MGETIVTSCDSAEVLEASEHALDGIAVSVENRREAVLPAPIDLGRNVRRGSLALDLAADGVGVIALVAIQDGRDGHLVEQHIGGNAIRHLAAGQEERDRTTELIGERMDFRRAPTARAANCLIDLPPFPPEALR